VRPTAAARGLEGAYQLVVDDVVLVLVGVRVGLGLEAGVEAGG